MVSAYLRLPDDATAAGSAPAVGDGKPLTLTLTLNVTLSLFPPRDLGSTVSWQQQWQSGHSMVGLLLTE